VERELIGSVRDRRPLYLRVTEAILQLATERNLTSGDRLPNETELATLFGVGRSSVREAMAHLELRGTVERRRGIGTVLVENTLEPAMGLETLESLEALAARQGWTCATADVEVKLTAASELQAGRLRTVPGAPVSLIKRMKLRNSTPICEMLSVIPTAVVPFEVLEHDFVDSVTDLLVRRHSPPLRFARAEVNAVICEPALARRLATSPGRPLVVIEELFFGAGETILAWNTLHFVPGRIRLEVVRRLGASSDGRTLTQSPNAAGGA